MLELILLGLSVIVSVIGTGMWFFSKGEVEHDVYHDNGGFWNKSKKTIGGVLLGIGLVSFVVLWLVFSIVTTATGEIKVVKTFGKVDITQKPLTEGVSFIKPWQSTAKMSIRQRHLDRNRATKSDMDMITKDHTKLNGDVTFYWKLNISAAAWIYQKFGKKYYNSIQVPSAAGSLREVVGQVEKWNSLVDDKAAVEKKATVAFKKAVIAKLEKAGIPKNIAADAFVFPKLDIRRITPPLKILTAIENKKAAMEDLSRQKTEIDIAAAKAKKGAQEGLRVRNMLLAIFNSLDKDGLLASSAKLPEQLTPADIPGIINAIATKQNAQSIQTAVESDGVNTILLPAGTPVATSVQ